MNKNEFAELVNEIEGLDCGNLGGACNGEAKELSDNSVIFHYYDGRRLKLTVEALPNGCAYDPATGETLT